MPCLECLTTWGLGLLTIVIAVFGFFQYQYTYWKRKGFPHLTPSFPFGNAKGLGVKISFSDAICNAYRANKEKLVGMWMFAKPVLIIKDLELVRTVLVKEFSHFHDRGFRANIKANPLQGHLFFLNGSKWRDIRIKMTPTFTSGKMKMMFPTLVECGEGLKKVLRDPADRGDVVEIKSVMASYTTEIIASCAFGLEINAFENPDSEFRKTSDFIFKPSLAQTFTNIFTFIWPEFTNKLAIKIIPHKVENFFLGAVEDTFRERKEKNIKRNDFLQLMIQLTEKGFIEDSEVYSHGEQDTMGEDYDRTFTVKEAAAQAFVFFVAGFETASTTMQFCLYELARNQRIQEKVREEVDRVLGRNGGKLTYEGIQEMDYLDQVVSETLRKYPPAPVVVRECTKSFRFPDTALEVDKGTMLVVSILGIHTDPQYYPHPEVFDPDRFSQEEKAKRPANAFIPFGDGPRICIGMRFGLMETKTGLAILLSNYKVDMAENTPRVLEFNPGSLLTSLKGGLPLRVLKR